MCVCTCDSFRTAPQRCIIGILYDSSTAGVAQCYVRKCKVLWFHPPNKGTSNLCEGSLKWREVSARGKGFPPPWISIKTQGKDTVQSALLHSPFLPNQVTSKITVRLIFSPSMSNYCIFHKKFQLLSLSLRFLICLCVPAGHVPHPWGFCYWLECEITVVKTPHRLTAETPSRAIRWT